MDSKSGIIHYMDGTTDVIYDEVAEMVKEAFVYDRVPPQGAINLINSTIFLTNVKKIEWNF